MANFLTPPTMRKKKPDFWGGFATALSKEVQRRAALKDQKELSQFNTNEGVRAAELGAPAAGRTRQSVFDIAQFGQDLTPDVVVDITPPDEQYKFTGVGVKPTRLHGPPAPEAKRMGIGGAIAGMRRKAAEENQKAALQALRNQGNLQRQEMVGEQKVEQDERKARYDTLSAEQKHRFQLVEIKRRSELARSAKAAGVDTKIISGALNAANGVANAVRRAYGTEDEATDAHDEAFQNYIDTFAKYEHEIKPSPKDETGKLQPGALTPKPVPVDTDSTVVDPLVAEGDRILAQLKVTSDPAKRAELSRQYEELKRKSRSR